MRIVMWVVLTLSIGLLIAAAGFIAYDRGYAEGHSRGYTAGSIAGAGSGYEVRNPTYDELMDFIADDRTDDNEYQAGTYTCVDFVADLNNNAEQAGYRAAYVYIEFPDNSAHSITAFSTVDKGLVYIEPQFDDEVRVQVGTSYAELNGYEIPDYDDTVIRTNLVW